MSLELSDFCCSTDTCSWLSHDSTHSSPDDTKLPLGEPGAGPEQPANIQAKRGTMSKQHFPNYYFHTSTLN